MAKESAIKRTRRIEWRGKMIEYVRRCYYWIPRGNDTLTSGGNGPYSNIPAGYGFNWITDTLEPLPARFWHLYLPAWLPQQLLICGTTLALIAQSSGVRSNLVVTVDPGGKAFASAG